VTYPYYGYYSYYDYPYFSNYGYADCGFYSGFYIRFGHFGSSYFSGCSGFSHHAYHRHHHHVYACAVHGQHYYHVRDCYQCYPDAAFHEDVEVPHVAPAEDGAPAAEAVPEPVPGAGGNVVSQATPAADPDGFFASLRPAQLSFAIGLMHFREGRYEAATESFYNASLEDPESRLVRVFLAESLFAVGEYSYSAEYLRLALGDWEEFPRYRWSVAAMYTNPDDFRLQLATLEAEAALHPNDPDLALVLGFVRFGSGDLGGAGESFDAVRTFGEGDGVRGLASGFIREIEHRGGRYPRSGTELSPLGDFATARFLASLELADIKDLDMR